MQYEKLNQREHVLLRPDTYIGSVIPNLQKRYVFDSNIVNKNIIFPEGIERIYLEILSNAADNVQRSRDFNIDPGCIKVKATKEYVQVYNEGKSIPIFNHKKYQIPIPELIFCNLLTSSNYDDSKQRILIGRNGIGAKATNIFSKKFIIEIGYEGYYYRQVCTDNMSKVEKPKIYKDESIFKKLDVSPSFVRITYFPDFKRFNLECHTDEIIQLFHKYAIDVAFIKKIPVFFNNIRYQISIQQYGNLYIDSMSILIETSDSQVLILDCPNNGNIISFVNGIPTKEGVHVDGWLDAILREISKKVEINKREFKKHFLLIINCTLINPVFSGQSKEKLSHPVPHIEISNLPITRFEGYSLILKEKHKANMKKTDGKKIKYISNPKIVDANFAATSRSKECTLFLTEGDSAATNAILGIGSNRAFYGVFPLKGKIINISKASNDKIFNNQEIKAIKEILGLKEDLDYSNERNFNSLRYGSICIFADQDVDGRHIEGLIYNIFRCNYPSLLKRRGFVKVLYSPLIKATKGKVKEIFYTERQFKEWLISHPGYEITYYKGIGSLEPQDIKEIFTNKKLISLEFDIEAEGSLSLAFDEGKEDLRKKWILEHKENNNESSTITEFVYNDLILYSIENIKRCIPSILDGLKPSQRKILYVIKDKFIKVFQLAGQVADVTKYHHGETSLCDTIIRLGQSYIGSNNLPLIEGKGQFGTRRGEDSAAPRYIWARKSSIFPFLFRKEDEILLQYEIDEGTKIEPRNYYPILPVWLINGAEGIGTGFKCSINPRNLYTIISWITKYLLSKQGNKVTFPELSPYYKGYDNIIKDGTYFARGKYKIGDTIQILDIPVTYTIKEYKKRLVTLRNKGIIQQFSDKSYSKGNDIQPEFEIIGYKFENLKKFEKDFLMNVKIPNETIHMFDKDNKIHVFKDIYEALEHYCDERLEKYRVRKELQLSKMNKDLEILNKKICFLEDVNENRINLKLPEEELIKVITERGYLTEFLNIPIKASTISGISRLKQKKEQLEKDIQSLTSLSPAKIWSNEIKEFISYASTIYQNT